MKEKLSIKHRWKVTNHCHAKDLPLDPFANIGRRLSGFISHHDGKRNADDQIVFLEMNDSESCELWSLKLRRFRFLLSIRKPLLHLAKKHHLCVSSDWNPSRFVVDAGLSVRDSKLELNMSWNSFQRRKYERWKGLTCCILLPSSSFLKELVFNEETIHLPVRCLFSPSVDTMVLIWWDHLCLYRDQLQQLQRWDTCSTNPTVVELEDQRSHSFLTHSSFQVQLSTLNQNYRVDFSKTETFRSFEEIHWDLYNARQQRQGVYRKVEFGGRNRGGIWTS